MSVSFYGYYETDNGPHFTEQANFSNVNARLICAHLDLDFDADNWAGNWPVEEVKSRCVLARAVGGALTDDGMPSVRDGNMIDCGLRPGYFADAVAALEEVVAECEARGITRLTYA